MWQTILREKRARQFLGVLVLAVTLLTLVTWYVRHSAVRDEVGKAATEVLHDSAATPYTTLTGEPFSFAPYRGSIRVVNVWASWSPFALTELPILNAIAANYGSDQAVVTIAVNRKEQKERAAAYLASLPELPNVIYAIDETDAFYQSVGGYAMPETIIFDERGDIVWHYRGVITYDDIAAELDVLLQ